MRKVCFLSMDDLGGYVADDDLAIEPLRQLDWHVETLSWRQTEQRWSDFAAVVIRTPWDYQKYPREFLTVLELIGYETRLLNPLSIVRWNLNKKYLRDLESRGSMVVPTLWDEEYSLASYEQWPDRLGADEMIIKPTVSATAEHTYRLSGYDPTLEGVFADREFMVQPFIRAIVDEGEYSLFYFNGEYSHTILKAPKPADFRVQEEHGGIISEVEPEVGMLDAGVRALDAIGESLLYARVDLVRHEGAFAVMELELIEPALYLRMNKGAPERFARAFDMIMSK